MGFKRLRNLSPWRKLALVTWGRPSDPSAYALIDFEISRALQVIDTVNAHLAQKHGDLKSSAPKITLTHFIAKGIALTLSRCPAINGIICWNNIYLRDSVDIFLQVAVPNEADPLRDNLSGAKVSGMDGKSLEQIAIELSDKAKSIRAQKDPVFQKTFNIINLIPVWMAKFLLRLHEFLIYNLGVHWPALGLVADPFGSAMVTSVGMLGLPPGFAPLVPPSRCPMLACVGAVQLKPWAIDSTTVAVRPVVGVSFTVDHRFIDGFMASRMLRIFRDFMADPEPFLVQDLGA